MKDNFDDALQAYLSNIEGKKENSNTSMEKKIEKKVEIEEEEVLDENEEVITIEDNIDLPLEEHADISSFEFEEDEDINEEENEDKQDNPEEKSDKNEEEVTEENNDENDEREEENKSDDKAEERKVINISNMLEDADPDDLIDVNDPSLYSDNPSDSISFDELNDGNSDESEEGFTGEIKAKKSFDSLKNTGKKKFEPGRLNKNNMMIAVFGFLFIVLAGLVWAGRDKEKKAKKKQSGDDYLSINGYKPDFGDYKNRAYKGEDLTDKNDEAMDKINEILVEGNKDPYVNPEEVYRPDYVPVSYSSGGSSQSAPADDTYKQRVESSLRKNILGKNTEASYLPLNLQGAGQTGMTGVSGVQNSSQGYFDQLGSIASALGLSRGGQNVSQSQNDYSLRFTNAGKYDPTKQGGDISYIPENSIYPGTIISAVLVSGINTDYPGMITARVINNVYDSRTGTKLLIPSGSILRGSYSSSSIGISKIQIAWQTLILNRDGRDFAVNLGSMVGVDSKGYSGIKGSLNEHAFAYLKAAGISCLFTFINSNIFTYTKKQKNRTTQEMIENSQDIGNKLADKILDRALDIQPTVTVNNTTRINVDVDRILTLYPYDRDMPVQKYIRQ